MLPLASQRGTGLIEVMISLTLGLLILVALLKAYTDSKATFRTQDSVARLQENARYAVNIISRDLRMAGYRGCVRDASAAALKNTLNTPSAFRYDFAVPVQGFEGHANGTWTPSLDGDLASVTRATDVIAVRGVLDTGTIVRQEMPNTSADLKVTDNMSPLPLANGDIVMVSDCQGSAIFQITNFTANNGNIAHNTGIVSPPPGNATQDLGRRYPAGSQVFKVATTSYFIRDSSSGSGPALWQRVGDSPAQELAEGVIDMQVQYGLDTDGDLMPNSYVNASTNPNYRNVVSVRIAMLFRSLENASNDIDQRSFTLLDRVVGPFNDGRMYQVMTTTIALRNKAL
jgi:type IV pilus assembly protein PilW